ncbi:MAG: DUF1311 domain-containing protein [Proteobacteria bacterium]|nr:MAG: DUF1311 domain-containing protein [Pseudomonadota bacterium]
MKNTLIILAAIAAAAPLLPASAFMTNPIFQDPRPARCDTTFDMQHCAAHDLRVADAEMSMRYNNLRGRLGGAARQRLLAEQRTWLKARDRQCIAKGKASGGGTMAPVVVAQCWIDMTKQRSVALSKRR